MSADEPDPRTPDRNPWEVLRALDREYGLSRGQRAILDTWRTLDLRRLWRVLGHSLLVGVFAGLVAAAFFYALEWAQYLLLSELAHVPVPVARGEQGITPARTPGEMVVVATLLLPAAGGLLVGLLGRYVAPEAQGPGGDAFIEAFHLRAGLIRKRVPIVKAIASLLTIGTGGSAGREGPTMHVGAGVGSALAQALRLDVRERRILIVAGAAAGTGAIFRTPLGAALFAVEALYRDDFETDAVIPSVLASVTSYSVFTTIFGQGHLFMTAADYPFEPLALPCFGLMAVGLSLFGAAYVRLRHRTTELFEQLRIPAPLKPALGGLLLGALALFLPEILGVGYGWVQGAIEMRGGAWISMDMDGVWLLLGLAAAKMLATALTTSSGGSGGDFGPSLVIGGLAGGGFGLLFHLMLPGVVPDPGAFVLVGMGAFVGGIGHVPVSSLIMVCEMTGSYDLLVPLMLVEGITFVLLRPVAIYRKQLPARLDSPAHRDEVTVDILESVVVRDVYERGAALDHVRPDAHLREVLRVLSGSDYPALLVRDDGDRPIGVVSLDTLQVTLLEDGLEDLMVAADLMVKLAPLRLDDDLHHALHAFLGCGARALPVVDESGAEVGVLAQVAVTRAYDTALDARLRETAPP